MSYGNCSIDPRKQQSIALNQELFTIGAGESHTVREFLEAVLDDNVGSQVASVPMPLIVSRVADQRQQP